MKWINKDTITIKEPLDKGIIQCEISKLLKLKKSKINYISKKAIQKEKVKNWIYSNYLKMGQ